MIRKATSTFTREHVEARLEHLRRLVETQETRREIEYLEDLKQRKGW